MVKEAHSRHLNCSLEIVLEEKQTLWPKDPVNELKKDVAVATHNLQMCYVKWTRKHNGKDDQLEKYCNSPGIKW